jgi:hypothetical protein
LVQRHAQHAQASGSAGPALPGVWPVQAVLVDEER